ncbi:MAG: hypothetical protein ACLFTG_05405 [Alphaproteobacteria bacterium]
MPTRYLLCRAVDAVPGRIHVRAAFNGALFPLMARPIAGFARLAPTVSVGLFAISRRHERRQPARRWRFGLDARGAPISGSPRRWLRPGAFGDPRPRQPARLVVELDRIEPSRPPHHPSQPPDRRDTSVPVAPPAAGGAQPPRRNAPVAAALILLRNKKEEPARWFAMWARRSTTF